MPSKAAMKAAASVLKHVEPIITRRTITLEEIAEIIEREMPFERIESQDEYDHKDTDFGPFK